MAQVTKSSRGIMANIGNAAAGKTLIGTGSTTSPTFADIGTNSGLTEHGIVIAQNNGAFQATSAGSSGQVLTSNGPGVDPSFQGVVVPSFPVTVPQGGTGRTSLTNHGVIVGAGTNAVTQLAAGSAGQILQSGGASADPAYSTATYPSTAGTSGNFLKSDGTNWSSQPVPNSFAPYQFRAYLSATAVNVTGDGTAYTIIYDGVTFDQGGGTNYNNTTGFYTVPATGLWLFGATVSMYNFDASHTSGVLWFNQAGTLYQQVQLNPTAIDDAADVNTLTMTFSCLFTLTASDPMGVAVQVSGSGKTVGVRGGADISSVFWGFRIA